MTVKELIAVSPFCDFVQIVVRNHGCGRWIQGYRIGKEAKLYPVNCTREILEKYNLQSHQRQTIPLNEGDEIDCEHGRGLPMKVICKDVSKIPDNVANLTVAFVQPRHIPEIHREQLTHNNYEYDIDCFPDSYVPEPKEKQEKTETLDGQMTFDEWLEGI